MIKVSIDEWGVIEEGEAADYCVLVFSDLKTIKRPAAIPVDLSLALQEVGERLFNHQKHVVATKRNKDNNAWLALCLKSV
jgi:hypothetical protein